jgi:myosin heavy subunit
VHHYAGEVYYDVNGFAQKNKDLCNQDMKVLMSNSTNYMLKKMMEDSLKNDNLTASTSVGSSLQKKGKKSLGAPVATPGKSVGSRSNTISTNSKSTVSVSKLKEDSVSKQFTISLRHLCDTLDSTTPHYVRCIKPNSAKLPDKLNVKDVLLQLKYSGMIETIRIRQEGYSSRMMIDDFFHRYQKLEPTSKTIKELIQKLSKVLLLLLPSFNITHYHYHH